MNKAVKKLKRLSTLVLALSLLQTPLARATITMEKLEVGMQYRDNSTDPNIEEDGKESDSRFEYRVKARVRYDINDTISIKTEVITRPEDGLTEDTSYHALDSERDLGLALSSVWLTIATENLVVDAGAFSAQRGLGVVSLKKDERYTLLGVKARVQKLSQKYSGQIEITAGRIDRWQNRNLFDEEDLTEKDPNYIDMTFSGPLAKAILVQGGVIHYREAEITDKDGNVVEADPNDSLNDLVDRRDGGNYWHLGAAVPIGSLIFGENSPLKATLSASMIARFDDDQKRVIKGQNGAQDRTVDVDEYSVYNTHLAVEYGPRLKAHVSYYAFNRHDPLAYLYTDINKGINIALQGVETRVGDSDEGERKEGIFTLGASYELFCGIDIYAFANFSDEDSYGGGVNIDVLKVIENNFRKSIKDKMTGSCEEKTNKAKQS